MHCDFTKSVDVAIQTQFKAEKLAKIKIKLSVPKLYVYLSFWSHLLPSNSIFYKVGQDPTTLPNLLHNLEATADM